MATQTIEFKDAAARAAHAVQSEGPSSGDDLQDLHGDKMVLNMGPSHPSTHGVLRILIELDGEGGWEKELTALCDAGCEAL